MSTLQPAPAGRQQKRELMEQERAKILLADPHIEHLYSNCAFCRLCQHWVALHQKCKYYAKNWLAHKRSREHKRHEEAIKESQNKPQPLEVEKTGTRRRSRTTAKKRAEELSADPDISIVHDDRVLCRVCDKWIELGKTRRYERSNWFKHKTRQKHIFLSAGPQHQPTQSRTTMPSDTPSYHLAVPLIARQDLDTQSGNQSNASSPSVYFTPQMDFPVPESPPSPIDSSIMGLYPLSVLDTLSTSDRPSSGRLSAAPVAQMNAGNSISHDLHDPKPAITSILSFIKSELSPSPPYTRDELTTTARILHDLVERGTLGLQ